MKRAISVFVVALLFVAQSIAQVVKPPYILGKNDVRIHSKNFLAGKKPGRNSKYLIYNNRKPGGASIEFDKRTNEFEIVTGADNDNHSIRLAKQELRNAEKVLLAITGIAPEDKCKLKILMRIIVPDTTDGGLSFDHLPSCGEF